MIVPPYWIWDFSGFDADKLGIDLHKRDGAPRKIRLQSVGISYGRAIYQMQIIGGDGTTRFRGELRGPPVD